MLSLKRRCFSEQRIFVMKSFINKTRSTTVALLLLAASVAGVQAQNPTKEPPTQSPVPVPASPGATPFPSPGQSDEATEERPLYGVQGVLVETLGGAVVASQSPDALFNPASSVKLATALAALRTFGPQYRYTTTVWTDGKLDKTTGTLDGNLFVSGRDPSFHYEHGVMIALQLNTLGIRAVTGDLIIGQGFTMNFDWSARRSGEQLYDTLDATLRSPQATDAWIAERTAAGDQTSIRKVPHVAVMGEVQVSPVVAGANPLLTHRSSKLVDILKVLLCYSNNFMAERIGDSMGGKESVERQLTSSLGIPVQELRLGSLSGLGVNRVSPNAMMKILRALRQELQKNRLSPSDILPVAGVDPGTLEDRFTSLASRGSVIAKTGTLVRTDGGVSSLVGQAKAANGDVLLFVIMNQRGNVIRFRENQDYLVTQIQNSRGGPKAFDYTPLTLAIRLADTESNLGSGGDEYEPGTKVSPKSGP
jgi:D-alanyl-D-alanine carboxypeptidase/D-alanyl-D-alanine-endopeptidase (penicillin-binding protein 4)